MQEVVKLGSKSCTFKSGETSYNLFKSQRIIQTCEKTPYELVFTMATQSEQVTLLPYFHKYEELLFSRGPQGVQGTDVDHSGMGVPCRALGLGLRLRIL